MLMGLYAYSLMTYAHIIQSNGATERDYCCTHYTPNQPASETAEHTASGIPFYYT